jgi:hypothetical protein
VDAPEWKVVDVAVMPVPEHQFKRAVPDAKTHGECFQASLRAVKPVLFLRPLPAPSSSSFTDLEIRQKPGKLSLPSKEGIDAVKLALRLSSTKLKGFRSGENVRVGTKPIFS